MTKSLFTIVLAISGLAQVSPTGPSSVSPSPVTFNKDVLPILQQNCQVCHRPGEAGPMSFLTYESTRPWARAISQAVVTKKMPPWFADPHYGEFRNAPKLSESDIETLVAWADSGAAKGDDQDKPAPVEWQDGWRINPDIIVSMPEPYSVPAKGNGEVKGFIIKSPFKEDTWVSAIEIRPGDRSVVHHVVVQTQDPDARASSSGMAKLATPPFVPAGRPIGRSTSRGGRPTSPGYGHTPDTATFATMEAVYFPGAPPMDFRLHDAAKLFPGGRDIRIEVHYMPNGTATKDQTRVGFTLASAPPARRFVTLAPTTMVDKRDFRIPAGEPDWESTGELTFTRNAELVWFMPHMHLRGKDMTYRLEYPNGRSEIVLSAKFDFYWQLGYDAEQPIKAPKGTKLIVTAHYDNSVRNKSNPDPRSDVRWGELTSSEMMVPWLGLIVDRAVDPDSIISTPFAESVSSSRFLPLMRKPDPDQ